MGNKDSRATCHKGTPEQRTENICSCEYPLEEWMSENQRNMGTSQKFFIMWSSPFTIYTRTSRFFKFFGNFFLRFSQELFLSLCIPGQARFLSFLHRKIPDIFLGYRGLGSITSRWGGSSDCKPTSLHGYAANWDLNFKKTFNLLHFYHTLYYDFTT